MGFLGPLLRRFSDARLVEFRRPPRRKEVSPSVSMYFADPLADLIDDDESFSGRPIQQLSPSLYVCGQTAIVIRHTNRHEIKILREGKFERIFLLIDDDFDCLGEADGLPPDYRARLVKYREGPFRNLLELVTDVVAPSERILRPYRRQRTMLLEPAQCHRIAGLDHHKASDMIDIVFAGTRAHVYDFEHVAPGFAEVLRRHSNVRLTTFIKGHVPKALRRLPNAVHMSPMGWQQYRRFVDSNKYHIAVAPALPTPFNHARSISKLHDHAALGAAGIYTSQAPFDQIVSHGRTGLLLGHNPADWRDTLSDLVEKREKVVKLARGGQLLSETLGKMGRVRKFWKDELGLR